MGEHGLDSEYLAVQFKSESVNSSITDPLAHVGAAPHKIRIHLQIVKARRQTNHL